jgi:hypothetical protein
LDDADATRKIAGNVSFDAGHCELLNSRIERAIDNGLAFLARKQKSSGQFESVISTEPTMSDAGQPDSAIFPTALIAYSLGFLGDSARQIVDSACSFLAQEMLPGSLFRYWTKLHPYYTYIPPDTDDTACALYVLRQNGFDVTDVSDLFLANVDSRGRFYTWILPRWSILCSGKLLRKYWRAFLFNYFKTAAFFKMHEAAETNDVDAVVNANALFYTGLSPQSVPIVGYMIEIIEQNRESKSDKWHCSCFNFYYSVSRLYCQGMYDFESVRETIITRIEKLANHDGSGAIGGNALESALAICSLINLNHQSAALQRAVQYLLSAQQSDGSWKRSYLYFGGPQYAGPEQFYGWGADELTTGFALEALKRYCDVLADGRQ